jgi:cytochrome d ubiquinol oxidase subunit II
MTLETLWYGLVVLCWVLFLVLEGFDFGVGLLTPLLGRDDHERGAVVRTIGPFWDGNEVWLVAAIGATFAAFPAWYAALLSGLYLPLVLLLLLLAGRGVALEFRGKGHSEAWRRRCDLTLSACSAGVVVVLGAFLAAAARGLALDPAGDVRTRGWLERTAGPVLTWSSLGGALTGLFAAALLGATYLGLRTTGPVRSRARMLAVALGATGVPAFAVAGLFAPVWFAGATVCLVTTVAAWAGREPVAFAAAAVGVAAATVLVFWPGGSVVLASTLDPALSLTLSSSAATPSTLRLLTVAGGLILPGVVAYQVFSYWVFRQRVTSERVLS